MPGVGFLSAQVEEATLGNCRVNVRERGRKPYVVDGSLDPALIPLFTRVLYIPGGDRRISEPSTVGKIPPWTPPPL